MKAHILYVEDDGVLRRAVTRGLTTAGYEVLACATSFEAKIALEAFRFDAVISDWDLGDGGTGGQVYDHVKMIQPQLARRFMFVSGTRPEVADHVIWLEKPAAHSEILSVLADLAVPNLRRQTDVQGSQS